MCVMALRLVGNTKVLHSHQQPCITVPLSNILLQCPQLPRHLLLNLGLNKQDLSCSATRKQLEMGQADLLLLYCYKVKDNFESYYYFSSQVNIYRH